MSEFSLSGILRFHTGPERTFDTSNDTVIVTRALLHSAADEIDTLGKDLAEAVRLLDGLLGLERGSGAAALLFVENHRRVGDVCHKRKMKCSQLLSAVP